MAMISMMIATRGMSPLCKGEWLKVPKALRSVFPGKKYINVAKAVKMIIMIATIMYALLILRLFLSLTACMILDSRTIPTVVVMIAAIAHGAFMMLSVILATAHLIPCWDNTDLHPHP